MTKTTDGVDIKEGMIVYYLDDLVIAEPLKSHVVYTTPIGNSIAHIKPVGGKIYSEEKMAKSFKKYLSNKRTEKQTQKFYEKKGYSPLREV